MLTILIFFLSSLVLTGVVRRYATRWRLLDIPNPRSSHSVPTPRGGGISIVVVFVLAVLWFVAKGTISNSVGHALVWGGLAVAVVGLLDDRFCVPAWGRLSVHFAAAGWALWQLKGMPPLHFGSIIWYWGWVGHLLAIIGLVWMINLFNFMDGIDGLAGVEVLSVSVLAALLLASNRAGGLAQVAIALATTSAGFLVWNWPPAKIFMGDAGSGFLGFVFGVLAIASAKARPSTLSVWLILLSVFIVDATVTLIRRLVGGARWSEAHRNHAYQHAARQWGSHCRVTLSVGAVNVVWLFPLGWATSVWPSYTPLFAITALVSLIYVVCRYGAGRDATAKDGRRLQTQELEKIATGIS
jgi:Fuc2NAc and GlcNAc transferase